MYDQSDAESLRRLRTDRGVDERQVGGPRREADSHGLRQAEEPAEGVSLQGVIWRWHMRRRRER